MKAPWIDRCFLFLSRPSLWPCSSPAKGESAGLHLQAGQLLSKKTSETRTEIHTGEGERGRKNVSLWKSISHSLKWVDLRRVPQPALDRALRAKCLTCKNTLATQHTLRHYNYSESTKKVEHKQSAHNRHIDHLLVHSVWLNVGFTCHGTNKLSPPLASNRHWGNLWEMGRSAHGLFQALRYCLVLNFPKNQPPCNCNSSSNCTTQIALSNPGLTLGHGSVFPLHVTLARNTLEPGPLWVQPQNCGINS